MINNKSYKNKWSGSDLDRIVYISTVASIATDTTIETITWSAEKEVPAHVIELPASREQQVQGALIYDRVMSVVIRWKTEYTTTKIRLKYNDVFYDVIESREGKERRRWLILDCRYGGKQLGR